MSRRKATEPYAPLISHLAKWARSTYPFTAWSWVTPCSKSDICSSGSQRAREVAVTAVIIAAIDLSSKTVKATFDGDSLQGVGGLVCDGHLVYGTSHKLNGVFMIRTAGGRGESPKVVEMAPLVRCDGGSLGMAGRPQGIAMRRRRGRAADGQASLFVTDYDGGRVLRLEVGACPLGSAALNGVQLSVLLGSREGVAVESTARAAALPSGHHHRFQHEQNALRERLQSDHQSARSRDRSRPERERALSAGPLGGGLARLWI